MVMIDELYELGYRQGTPYWGMIDGASIDNEVCRDGTCDKCGHKGLEYKPFIKDDPRSYRDLAICPNCNDVTEF